MGKAAPGHSKRARWVAFGALGLVPLLPLGLWNLHAVQLPSFDEHVAAQRGPTGVALRESQTRLEADPAWRIGAAAAELDAALPRFRSRYDVCIEHAGAKLVEIAQEIEVTFDAQCKQRLAIETRTLGVHSDPRFHGHFRIVLREMERALERGGLDSGELEIEAHAFAGAGESRVELVRDAEPDRGNFGLGNGRTESRRRLRRKLSPFVEPLDQGYRASVSQALSLCAPEARGDDSGDAWSGMRLRSSTDEYDLTATVRCSVAWDDAPLSYNGHAVSTNALGWRDFF